MLELFAFGGILFWVVFAVAIVSLLVSTEYEKGIAAFISICGFLVFLQLMAGVNLIGYIKAHPYFILIILACYLIIGVCWLTFKWILFVKKRLAVHDETFREFLKDKNLPEDTKVLESGSAHKRSWKSVVKHTEDYNTKETIADVPKIKNHKKRVINWMSLWPFSMISFFLKDMVVEFFDFVYKSISTYLQRIANNIYARSEIKSNLDD